MIWKVSLSSRSILNLNQEKNSKHATLPFSLRGEKKIKNYILAYNLSDNNVQVKSFKWAQKPQRKAYSSNFYTCNYFCSLLKCNFDLFFVLIIDAVDASESVADFLLLLYSKLRWDCSQLHFSAMDFLFVSYICNLSTSIWWISNTTKPF